MKRVWKKVLIASVAGVLVIGLLAGLAYSKRCAIIIWHLQANTATQEMVIIEMLKQAKPIIERELKMTLPEKIFSRVTGNRSEKERQRNAPADIREFVELGFKNGWIRFKDVHDVNCINSFPCSGFEFALDWNHGNTEEVLIAFNISFLERKVEKMQVNDNCTFFTELKSYVETKAKED
ncbi:MAG TPA: hypothetical protein VIJ25_11285 [Methylococcales bacterium]